MTADRNPFLGANIKPTLRYFFVATALIAISLAIYMQPLHSMSAPTVMLLDEVVAEPEPLSFSEVIAALLGSLPMRLVSAALGVGTLMHLIATVLGLTGFRRWFLGVGAPLLGVIALHFASSDRKIFSVLELSIFSTIVFTVGFGVVSSLFHALFSANMESDKNS